MTHPTDKQYEPFEGQSGSRQKDLAKKMVLNRVSLRFTGPTAHLEQPFIAQYNQRSVKQVRIMLILGTLLYAGFGILDAVLIPDYTHLTWPIRFFIVCPALLLIALYTFRPAFKTVMQPLLSAMLLLAGGGIIFMIVIAPPPINYSYYAGLILIFFFGYTLFRVRFVWVTTTSWLLVIMYEIAATAITHTPWPILVNNNFFFISANVAGMLACYLIEYYTRRDFFSAHLLEQERKKVAHANVVLEQRVQTRTAELQEINRNLEQEIADRKKAEQERSKLQQQLRQAERMETIGRLASGVAHDLNNILSGLVGYPELLLLDTPEDSPQRESLLAIQNSGQKAAAVVQDLLSLARQAVTEKEVLNVNELVQEFLQSPECQNLRQNHPHVQVEAAVQNDLLNVRGSQVHLMKVLMNLANNAAEANLVKGRILIRTQSCYLDRPLEAYEKIQEGEYTLLSVSDTGTGIASDDLNRIFEPFYTKKRLGRSGTGLGMTLVWATVKEHGGYIDIQTEEGKGSTFDLYLPATREPISKKTALKVIEDFRGTERILVVDDIPEQREIAAEMLSKLGYRTQTVASGEEALTYLKNRKADLLVLDMIMDPGIDGCETYKRVIEQRPGQKAVIASGFSESERVKEAQKLGAGPYLKKPYTLAKLAETVRTELNRSSCL